MCVCVIFINEKSQLYKYYDNYGWNATLFSIEYLNFDQTPSHFNIKIETISSNYKERLQRRLLMLQRNSSNFKGGPFFSLFSSE